MPAVFSNDRFLVSTDDGPSASSESSHVHTPHERGNRAYDLSGGMVQLVRVFARVYPQIFSHNEDGFTFNDMCNEFIICI